MPARVALAEGDAPRGRWMSDGDPLLCHALPCNKGGFVLLLFERQVADLLHEGLLDLAAGEFRLSPRKFP